MRGCSKHVAGQHCQAFRAGRAGKEKPSHTTVTQYSLLPLPLPVTVAISPHQTCDSKCTMGKGEEVSEAVQGLVAQLTRERLNPLMKQSFLCCAECCDNEGSQEALQAWYGRNPLQGCSWPANQHQT